MEKYRIITIQMNKKFRKQKYNKIITLYKLGVNSQICNHVSAVVSRGYNKYNNKINKHITPNNV